MKIYIFSMVMRLPFFQVDNIKWDETTTKHPLATKIE